jgi:hypothetical protein
MRKRTRKDVLQKAAPDLFGNRQVEVHTNYVGFPVPAVLHKKVREWLDKGDGDRFANRLTVGTMNQDKELRIIIINEREQRLYEARGHKDN